MLSLTVPATLRVPRMLIVFVTLSRPRWSPFDASYVVASPLLPRFFSPWPDEALLACPSVVASPWR